MNQFCAVLDFRLNTVVLEGVNGSGKTTVGNAIKTSLTGRGLDCIVADPTQVLSGLAAVRNSYLDKGSGSRPDDDAVSIAALRLLGAKQLLDRAQTEACDVLVLERWSLAISAYGAADGATPGLISELRQALERLISPDITIVLDLPGTIANERLSAAGERNRFEQRGSQFLERIAYWYRISAARSCRTVLIDAARDRQATVCETLNHVLPVAHA